MKKNITSLVTALIVVLMLSGVAMASTADQILDGFTQTGTTGGFNPQGDGAPQVSFTDAWGAYVVGLAGIFGALFMILMIYGGWLWMSAQGNDEQVGKAKKIIIGAVIGLTVVVSARLIAELAFYYLGTTLPYGAGPGAV